MSDPEALLFLHEDVMMNFAIPSAHLFFLTLGVLLLKVWMKPEYLLSRKDQVASPRPSKIALFLALNLFGANVKGEFRFEHT